MAYVNSRSASLGFFGRLAVLFGQLQEAASRRATYRRTVDALSAMTDRELSDIGIARASITDVARETAYQN